MSFEAEWAGHMAKAKSEQSTRMQLNQAGPEEQAAKAGKRRLHVTPSVLRAKAEDAADVTAAFMRADNKAMTETGQLKASLSGFDCASAFDTFEERWSDQMRYLRNRLSVNVVAALRKASFNFRGRDHGVKDEMDGVAEGNKGAEEMGKGPH
ncbi:MULTISPECIES: hypothetical protein [unclassified Streptomyces]|uniref:hypothetical protein n=1 Tax=unclassified Streptomyces TaxID=2593676 RepID=UPI002DD9550C|nr:MULTISPECIES: hypothetical protein [unclassified Streptomyces]WSA92158.1 hypothetical protein OIE63_11705 [Streptomyces sp. NBC_01795]WSB76523.1 hypothetical protein OHB04_12495 [Streptomyces sp. NBC_01775]WSS15188.1 hypothetical protein OG533_27355 [Streptomyces sp. NBC_01186]WSS44030.1 hypothetical protein OG220_28160 [Streptomyces sp. NBC_01187]